MKKYRMKPYDLVNDIWILQRRFLLVFWIPMGVGSKQKIEAKLAELEPGAQAPEQPGG